jgi:hypothetical protein
MGRAAGLRTPRESQVAVLARTLAKQVTATGNRGNWPVSNGVVERKWRAIFHTVVSMC